MRVAIVHRVLRGERDNLTELRELCKTAGYEVVYQLKQERPPHPKYNIGPGKVEELREIVKRFKIEKVVFENDLKPVQEYNLAKALKVPIITRTQLILEIFSMHASNIEAKLQIKLAELKYELPRAKEKVRLAKKGEQPGFHGLGAYEADVYYDEINRRIVSINRKLEAIKKHMDLLRMKRRKYGLPLISLAGYTNAGKSTLFKALTSEDVKISEQLFTTLTPTTRITRMDGKPVFISDTVGFIRNLPTLLVEAFYATLREIVLSDMILLVADLSDPIDELREKIDTSLEILSKIGAHNVPTLIVLNKLDLVDPDEASRKIEELDLELPYALISAKFRCGLGNLEKMVSEMLSGFIRVEASLPYNGDGMKILEEIYSKSKIFNVDFDNKSIKLKIEAPIYLAEKLRRYAVDGSFKVIE
ncbi:MAG: GTPase HflX [Thaumarchaeota archaeon]|nr:GTPase HflX [Nitrososphaerota archaeon]